MIKKTKCPCCDKEIYKVILAGDEAYVELLKGTYPSRWEVHTCEITK